MKILISLNVKSYKLETIFCKQYVSYENKDDSLKPIETMGADILEDRKTLINFKENNININLSKTPDHFQNHIFDFKFKKRKIIFKGLLKGEEEKFLFDSGTSAYELLTNKEVWEDLKLPSAKVTIENPDPGIKF